MILVDTNEKCSWTCGDPYCLVYGCQNETAVKIEDEMTKCVVDGDKRQQLSSQSDGEAV